MELNENEGLLVEDDSELENIVYGMDEGIETIYRDNWTAIRTHFKESKKNHAYYNIRWKTQTNQSWDFF